jgi:hypothetical protein
MERILKNPPQKKFGPFQIAHSNHRRRNFTNWASPDHESSEHSWDRPDEIKQI